MRLADHGVEHVGTYRIDGWMLELTCCYGTLRVPLGLFEEKALARKLLKHLAQKAAREVADETPHPATIAAAKAVPVRSVAAPEPRATSAFADLRRI